MTQIIAPTAFFNLHWLGPYGLQDIGRLGSESLAVVYYGMTVPWPSYSVWIIPGTLNPDAD